MVAPRFSSQRVVSSPGATMALRVTFGSISPGVGTVMRRLSVFNARTLVPLASPTAGQLARIWASSATVARATGSVATAPSSPPTIKETVDRIEASATESDPRVRRAGYREQVAAIELEESGARITVPAVLRGREELTSTLPPMRGLERKTRCEVGNCRVTGRRRRHDRDRARPRASEDPPR